MTLNHIACPCGKSSDAYTLNDSGVGHCFSCNKNFPPTDKGVTVIDTNVQSVNNRPIQPISPAFRAFEARALSRDTMAKYKVNLDSEGKATYPHYKLDVHTANKFRGPDKQFWSEGPISSCDLFGQQLFQPGSARAITVVEGQDDAMAAYEMMGSKYPVVSVLNAATAEQDMRRSFEYLNSFDTIVINFDNDDAGKLAAKKCANLPFPMGKVKVLLLNKHKDANDYKKDEQAGDYTKEWWQSPVHKPDGIKLGKEMWDEIINRPNHFQVDYPFAGLNKMTYGIRLSEFVVINAQTGVGKTSLLKTIEHALLTDPVVVGENYGVGFLHLEEPNGDTALGLLSIHNSQPYHLPDCPRPEADLRNAYDIVLNNDRVVIWDHFGSNSVDAVLDKIRHMYALGCRYIVLDHLSIVVSDQSGDERKQLDEISTRIKTLCMELNISVIAVIHQNRQGEIRGTAGVEQLANMVIKLERNTEDVSEWRRNVMKGTITKNRFCGRTGPALYTWYNETTGRLHELDQNEVQRYENGEDQDVPF